MRTGVVVTVAVVAGLLGVAARLATLRGLPPDASPIATDGQVPAPPVAVARVGDPLPSLRLPDARGSHHELRTLLRGRPALINFWATWCGPCRKEMPALSAFASQQGANGVQVVGIAIDDPEAVAAYLRDNATGYPILVDAASTGDSSVRLGDERGVLPYSVLVSRDGRILRQHAGALEPADLDDWARAAAPTPD